MNDRGEHRSFYVSILDDPDFQSMDGLTFKLLFALKLMLRAAGIGVIRKLALAEVLGCSLEELEMSFGLLERPKPGEEFGWILRERNIVWLINGLRHERGLSPKSVQHRAYIANQLKPLGNRAIVARFRSYYPEWFGQTSTIDGGGQQRAGVGSSGGIERAGDHRDGDGDSDRTEMETSDSDRRFLEAFYANASPARRDEVLSQLVASLSPLGARVRGDDFAFAKDRSHLDRCIAELIKDGVRIPDRAIVVLLKKLQNPILDDNGRTVTEAASATFRDDEKLIAEWNADQDAAARKWAKSHPAELAKIEQRATSELEMPSDMPGYELVRKKFLTQKCAEAAGFPGYEEWLAAREVTGHGRMKRNLS